MTLPSCPESQNEAQATTPAAQKSQSYIRNPLLLWRKYTIMEKTQVLLVLIGFINVLVIYCLTSNQIKISNDALLSVAGVSKTELRPFMWYEGISPSVPSLGVFTPTIIIKNFGKTPAFNLAGFWTVRFDTSYYVERIDFPKEEGTRFQSPIIPPEARMEWRISTSVITEPALRAILEGRLFFFIAVKMIYDQRIAHGIITDTTSFCVRYSHIDKKFVFYEGHNTDAQYEHDKTD